MLLKTFPVTCHTDFVQPDGIYVAIQGQNQNGLLYVEDALQKGAKTIIIERDVKVNEVLKRALNEKGATLKRVKNARVALARLSAEAAGHPAKKLKILAITGTKGKTTTVHILYHLLITAGFKTALISTIGNKISTFDQTFKTSWTTPQPDYLHQFFKLCVEQGIDYVVMETAAHAETFYKLETIKFDGAIFTNLEQEHGELYSTMEEYFQTKAAIMHRTKKDAPQIVNSDDEYGKRLYQEKKGRVVGYGQSENSIYHIVIPTHQSVFVFLLNNHQLEYNKNFPGDYNIFNIAAATAMCLELAIGFESIEKGLRTLPSLPGRYESYELLNGARAIIDYAHTPRSFELLFKSEKKRVKKLIVVFGASGGKDRKKRPMMGGIAAQYADSIIITSDNPGVEDPAIIAQEILSGIPEKDRFKVIIELDREQAIKAAYAESSQDSAILLLGKGPDEFQKIKGQLIPFSERAVLQKFT